MKDINYEVLQIVLWITIPGLITVLGGIFVMYFMSKGAGEEGRIYSIDDTYLEVYARQHKIHPKKIPLCEIKEVVIYHSWLEPGDIFHPRGRRFTVRVEYSNNQYIRFMISDRDAPDYKKSVFKTIFTGFCGYSFRPEAERARVYLMETLRGHGVKCEWE